MFLRKSAWFVIFVVSFLACSLEYAIAAGIPTKRKVTTILTFDAKKSQLPEGIAPDKNGNIFVSMYPIGELWKITPDLHHSILAKFDVGNQGGGLVGILLDGMGGLFVCVASFDKATHGIWHVDATGRKTMLAALDPSGFPNALIFDKDGNLLVTDSYLGQIWKVTASGQVSVWIRSPLLNPASRKCCYGANGLEFDRGDLFVANTDFGTIVQIKIGKDGKPHANLWVKSPALVGADGISFDVRHNAYVTADYQNLLVEVTQNGDIYTLATGKDGLDFPADTAFGQAPGQRSFLYWTTAFFQSRLRDCAPPSSSKGRACWS